MIYLMLSYAICLLSLLGFGFWAITWGKSQEKTWQDCTKDV